MSVCRVHTETCVIAIKIWDFSFSACRETVHVPKVPLASGSWRNCPVARSVKRSSNHMVRRRLLFRSSYRRYRITRTAQFDGFFPHETDANHRSASSAFQVPKQASQSKFFSSLNHTPPIGEKTTFRPAPNTHLTINQSINQAKESQVGFCVLLSQSIKQSSRRKFSWILCAIESINQINEKKVQLENIVAHLLQWHRYFWSFSGGIMLFNTLFCIIDI